MTQFSLSLPDYCRACEPENPKTKAHQYVDLEEDGIAFTYEAIVLSNLFQFGVKAARRSSTNPMIFG